MKKRMNIIFFGLCFLASLLAEGFCFQVLKGEWISTAGIGIVVIITGYLFMDSLRSLIKTNIDNLKFYMDRNLREETERWSERYTEIVNLQKATYTATKKNTVMITEQITKVLFLLQEQENNSMNSRQMLIELQKKAMEGQKNALNMQIHYGKENTKQLMDTISSKEDKSDVIPQLERVLELLDVNNDLLKNYFDKLSERKPESQASYEEDEESQEDSYTDEKGYIADNYDIEEYDMENKDNHDNGFKEDSIEAEADEDDYQSEGILQDEASDSLPEDNKQSEEVISENTENSDSANNDAGLDDSNEEPGFSAFYSGEAGNKDVKPLYADPNKALTADEIAALFASAGL